MKFKIIVDKIPESCKACAFHYNDDRYFDAICPLMLDIENNIECSDMSNLHICVEDAIGRHPDCPLEIGDV